MSSDRKIAANRANGALSRGPKTPEGKARSARNSLKHGLLARAILLEGESPARFRDLLDLLNAALRPSTPMEHLLVGKMAAAHWRQIRIWNLEKCGDRSQAAREMHLDRQFFRVLDRYLRIKTFFEETNPTSPLPATSEPVSGTKTEPNGTQSEPKNAAFQPIGTHPEPNTAPVPVK